MNGWLDKMTLYFVQYGRLLVIGWGSGDCALEQSFSQSFQRVCKGRADTAHTLFAFLLLILIGITSENDSGIIQAWLVC